MPYSSQIARPPPHSSKKRTAGGDSGEAGPSTKRRDDPGQGPSTAASDQRRSPVQAAPGPSNRAHEPDDLVTAGPEEEPGHSRSEPGHSRSRPGHSFRQERPPDCDSTEAAASSPTMVAERPVSLAVAMGLEVEEGCAVTSRDQLYKIGLPGKSILGDSYQENMTSRRPFLLLRIDFPGRPILYNYLQHCR